MTVTSGTIDAGAASIPAPFANTFQVTKVADNLVRITFSERLRPGAEGYRAAVTMTAKDAQEMALALLTMLGKTSPTLVSPFRSRASLEVEIVLLRQGQVLTSDKLRSVLSANDTICAIRPSCALA